MNDPKSRWALALPAGAAGALVGAGLGAAVWAMIYRHGHLDAVGLMGLLVGVAAAWPIRRLAGPGLRTGAAAAVLALPAAALGFSLGRAILTGKTPLVLFSATEHSYTIAFLSDWPRRITYLIAVVSAFYVSVRRA